MKDINAKIGQTIKKIRTSKGLRQKELNLKGQTNSVVSKHENGSQKITVENFLNYSKIFNVTVSEFIFISNGYHKEDRESLYDRFIVIHQTGTDEQLMQLHQDIECYHQENPLDPYLEVIDFYVVTLTQYRSGQLTGQEFRENLAYQINQLWQGLQSVNEWYWVDLRVINFILSRLPYDVIQVQVPHILARYEDFKDHREYLDGFSAFVLNLSQIHILNLNFKEAVEVLDLIKPEWIPLLPLRSYLTYLVRRGIATKDLDETRKAFVIMQAMGHEDYFDLFYVETLKHFPEYFVKYSEDFNNFKKKEDILNIFEDDYWILV
ncbi:helix-turn-helix domain-containing protein [Hutsoniella sourekii]|uniref:helix-turn-helix domain-containing protein n=1 Tax=Hutsoniella sourekii TaxID=87650 RepID=UPI0004860921|nr:helix-turn-helix transcriptional regulator [Hutsoniella sourekii]